MISNPVRELSLNGANRMNKQKVKLRIEKLKKEIEHHRYLYHVLDKQEISDPALDSLKKELVDLEQEFPDLQTVDSPSLRVSGLALDKFEKIKHKFPALSLQDVFSVDELRDWQERNEKIASGNYDYFCELKLDGLTIILNYEKGILKTAATRGDGKIGEDVTNNIRTIESVPLKLRHHKYQISDFLSIRGEVLLTKKYFNKTNKQRVKEGLEPFANPRNIAAGSIRQLNPRVTAQRELIYFAYDIKEDIGQKTHQEVHEILKDFGFKINPHNEYRENIGTVANYLQKWEKKRNSLDYLTDGVVIVVNDIGLEKKLGSIGKSERWMIAYKFPPEQVTSQVKDIIIQVGRTGALTPVAILEPRKLAGSLVSRATLHNFDEIERLGVKIGDTVIIQKAGDIIPEVVEVLKRLRTGQEKRVFIPKKCPVCNSLIDKKEGEVNYYCSNKNCYAIQKQNIIHFVSKRAFNIEGFGKKIVEQLMEANLIEDVADIFELKEDDLLPLERFADKSAENLIVAIGQSKKIDLDRFIYALGIRHVGDETSIVLARKFGSLEKLMKAEVEDFKGIHDIGIKVAQSLEDFFHQDKNIKLVQKLLDLGVYPSKSKIKSQKLRDKVFVLTGSLENLTREQAKNIIRELGGKVSSSISKRVDYLLLGIEPGTKYNQAQNLGLKIISEEDFNKMI